MISTSIDLTEYEAEYRRESKESYDHETNLAFLKTHNGHRNGKVHIYMGVSGAGKSTLLRTLMKDWLENNMIGKLGLLLSEETIDDLKDELSMLPYETVQSLALHRVSVISEMDTQCKTIGEFKRAVETFLRKGLISIFLFDNITTSRLYAGKSSQVQEEIQNWIKELCNELDIPFIIFAHTGAEITPNINRLINENDIRGNKGTVNLAQYFYIMQRFELGKMYFPTIKITKYRGYSVEDRLYFLNYDSNTSLFSNDHLLPWDEFNEAYKRRNILG